MGKDMANFLKKLGVKDGKLKEKVEHKQEIEVVSEDDTALPITEAECSKCGHNEAYWWSKQMRSSDEPETKFLKCTKCKHTWRE